MRKILLTTIVLALAATAATRVDAATIWDATNDFSIADNPNGAWSYGMVVSSDFVLFTHKMEGLAPAWLGWLSGDGAPGVAKNNGLNLSGYGIELGQLWSHPGPGGEMAVVRWTAPTGISASVEVKGRFFPGDSGGMWVGVFKNGDWSTPLWNQYNSGVFDLSVPVTAGQTIEFGVYGAYHFGSTPLEARVTGSVVPEPSAVMRWLSLAAVGAVVAWRWRRRCAA